MVQTMNEKLDKIVQIKESIRKSIVNKGQNLATSDPFDIYPNKIDAIVTNQSEPVESEDKFTELRQDLDIERPEDLDLFKSMKDLLEADTHEGNFKTLVLVKPIFEDRNNLVMNGFTLYDSNNQVIDTNTINNLPVFSDSTSAKFSTIVYVGNDLSLEKKSNFFNTLKQIKGVIGVYCDFDYSAVGYRDNGEPFCTTFEVGPQTIYFDFSESSKVSIFEDGYDSFTTFSNRINILTSSRSLMFGCTFLNRIIYNGELNKHYLDFLSNNCKLEYVDFGNIVWNGFKLVLVGGPDGNAQVNLKKIKANISCGISLDNKPTELCISDMTPSKYSNILFEGNIDYKGTLTSCLRYFKGNLSLNQASNLSDYYTTLDYLILFEGNLSVGFNNELVSSSGYTTGIYLGMLQRWIGNLDISGQTYRNFKIYAQSNDRSYNLFEADQFIMNIDIERKYIDASDAQKNNSSIIEIFSNGSSGYGAPDRLNNSNIKVKNFYQVRLFNDGFDDTSPCIIDQSTTFEFINCKRVCGFRNIYDFQGTLKILQTDDSIISLDPGSTIDEWNIRKFSGNLEVDTCEKLAFKLIHTEFTGICNIKQDGEVISSNYNSYLFRESEMLGNITIESRETASKIPTLVVDSGYKHINVDLGNAKFIGNFKATTDLYINLLYNLDLKEADLSGITSLNIKSSTDGYQYASIITPIISLPGGDKAPNKYDFYDTGRSSYDLLENIANNIGTTTTGVIRLPNNEKYADIKEIFESKGWQIVNN